MSPLLQQLARELAAELRAAETDPTAIHRIGDNVDRILLARHGELVAHEKASQS